jgi:hypothetical protein
MGRIVILGVGIDVHQEATVLVLDPDHIVTLGHKALGVFGRGRGRYPALPKLDDYPCRANTDGDRDIADLAPLRVLIDIVTGDTHGDDGQVAALPHGESQVQQEKVLKRLLAQPALELLVYSALLVIGADASHDLGYITCLVSTVGCA